MGVGRNYFSVREWVIKKKKDIKTIILGLIPKTEETVSG